MKANVIIMLIVINALQSFTQTLNKWTETTILYRDGTGLQIK